MNLQVELPNTVISGTYIMRINTKQGVFTKKLIVAE